MPWKALLSRRYPHFSVTVVLRALLEIAEQIVKTSTIGGPAVQFR